MAMLPKVTVLLTEAEGARFSAYCNEKGHKKSTLIARLIREHLDREGYAAQTALPLEVAKGSTWSPRSRKGGRR